MNYILNNYLKKIDKINKMLENNNYIKWLVEFTNKYNTFTNKDWYYKENELSDIDIENINELYLFFEILDNNASKYEIEPIKNNNEIYYNIIYNDNTYEIGVLSGQGALFFCTKKEYNNNINYIDISNLNYNSKLLNIKKNI